MPGETAGFHLRPAGADDAEAVAALHVASWRATYRGSLGDAYLDGPIETERRTFWQERLGRADPACLTEVAEDASGTLQGFVCGFVDQDHQWGSLIDNLHVAPGLKGRGLGRLLMCKLGAELLRAPRPVPVHLFVLTANEAATGFYIRLGGECVERITKTEPDGSLVSVFRVAWPSLDAFRAGVA